MAGKENSLETSPVRSLQLEGALPLEPQTPSTEREQNKASKDFSFPAVAGAGRERAAADGTPTQCSKPTGSRSAAKAQAAKALAAKLPPAAPAAAKPATAKPAAAKPTRQAGSDAPPPGRRTGQKTYTPHKGSGSSAQHAGGARAGPIPLGDATNKQPAAAAASPKAAARPYQPPQPALAPSTPPQQGQRLPMVPARGFASPGLPYNPYQLPAQPMYPPWTPHPAAADPSRRFGPASPPLPLQGQLPGQLQPYSYSPVPGLPPPPPFPPGLGPQHSPGSPPVSPQSLPLVYGGRGPWAHPMMSYAGYPGSPMPAIPLRLQETWSPELGAPAWAPMPWCPMPSPYHSPLPASAGWLSPRPPGPGSGLNVKKMASLCFQAQSKGTKAALSKEEVQALVEHQLRANQPVHAPWYRHGSTPAKPASPPGRLLEHRPEGAPDSDSPPGAGTGVWFPKSR